MVRMGQWVKCGLSMQDAGPANVDEAPDVQFRRFTQTIHRIRFARTHTDDVCCICLNVYMYSRVHDGSLAPYM